MLRFPTLVLAVLAAWSALGALPAAAQRPTSASRGVTPLSNRPMLSPYLNLLRGGNPAANYYLGTIPEVDRRANTRLFRTELQDLERQTRTLTVEQEALATQLPGTGHGTAFQNTGSYFGTAAPRLPQPRPQTPAKPK